MFNNIVNFPLNVKRVLMSVTWFLP